MSGYFNYFNEVRKWLTYKPGEFLQPTGFRVAADQCALLYRVFYLYICFLFYLQPDLVMQFTVKSPTAPLWPVAAIEQTLSNNSGVYILISVITLCLAATIVPWSLIVRIAVFLALFMCIAYKYSFGAINHAYHFLVYVSFLLLFLPNRPWQSEHFPRSQKLRLVSVFWLIQAVLLFCISMSGIRKVYGFGLEMFYTESLSALALGRSVYNAGEPIMLQGLVANYPAVFQVPHVGLIFIQVVSLLLLFKPHLIKAYGAVMILFHFGTYLLMGVTFVHHIMIWGLFLVLTPTAPRNTSLILMLRSIPFVGFLFKKRSSKGSVAPESEVYLIYDGECPFCSRFADYMAIRSNIGELHMLDARDSCHPVVQDVKHRDYDLDEGMVLIIGDRFYYGGEAIHVLTMLSKTKGLYAKLNKLFFSDRHLSNVVYPFFKLGRRITLTFLRVPKIPAS